MSQYRTRQRELLLLFLKNNSSAPLTVEEICNRINGISKSAIYRNITKLVENGCVQRFLQDDNRTFLYQYKGSKNCTNHLHMKCNKCGAVFHIDDKLTLDFTSAFLNHFGFEIDKNKTILLGNCSSCL